MAERILSPGVIARENDQSQITQQPVAVGAAIIGPALRGPVDIPTLVTSYSEYDAIFGGPISGSQGGDTPYTGISAYYYFQQGGQSLLVTRVGSGSFSSATATAASSSTNLFTLETIGEGDVMNSSGSGAGSQYNIKAVVDTNINGTFNLDITRGNDTGSILESYSNLSLEPTASNYIARVIGDESQSVVGGVVQVEGEYPLAGRYVRVSSVVGTDSNVIDQEMVFSGASGDATDPVVAGNYEVAVDVLSNADDYQFNVISTPGITTNADLLVAVQDRGDAIYVTDVSPLGTTNVGTVTTAAGVQNSSYAATYWPDLYVRDVEQSKNMYVPASTMIPSVYAASDATSDAWFAPAGFSRGSLTGVIRPRIKLTASQRDELYVGKVNPIANFPSQGIVVFGQKTLQTQASALDRVNVRRLLIEMKSYISQVALNLVFEQNTATTRNTFLAQVNPYLESIQQRQGLYAFKVVMDESNNTSDVIDRNLLIGQIFIQPTRTAEFIVLDFNILPTGATFTS